MGVANNRRPLAQTSPPNHVLVKDGYGAARAKSYAMCVLCASPNKQTCLR
jgi:hypothetical protein